MKTQTQALHRKYELAVLALCLVAGVLYNSWPLGYKLDNRTAHHGLASDLEKVGHPYYWLFILCDVLTGFCLLVVTALIFFKPWKKKYPYTILVVATGLALFGLFTGVAALLPSECTITGLLRCGADHGEGLGLDAITSSIAAFGLLVSMVYLCFGAGNKLKKTLVVRITQAALAAWVISGITFAVLALGPGDAGIAQDIFLIVSGLSIFVIGLNVAASLP